VPAGDRPGWLVNLTNDAWFGISPGPISIFQQARVRAIEEVYRWSVPPITAFSAVVDPLAGLFAHYPWGPMAYWIPPCPRRSTGHFTRDSETDPLVLSYSPWLSQQHYGETESNLSR